MLGNTDTIHYWDLTRNIYRLSPRRESTNFGVHAMDERIEMEAHLEGMRFYYDAISSLLQQQIMQTVPTQLQTRCCEFMLDYDLVGFDK